MECASVKMNFWWSKKKVTALWYSKVLQGRGTKVFKFQNVSCVSLQSKRFSFDFYWIPITLTIRLYQNELFMSRKWKWWFHFAIQWFYRWFFVEFKNDLRVFKNDSIFISAKLSLLWLCRFIRTHYLWI